MTLNRLFTHNSITHVLCANTCIVNRHRIKGRLVILRRRNTFTLLKQRISTHHQIGGNRTISSSLTLIKYLRTNGTTRHATLTAAQNTRRYRTLLTNLRLRIRRGPKVILFCVRGRQRNLSASLWYNVVTRRLNRYLTVSARNVATHQIRQVTLSNRVFNLLAFHAKGTALTMFLQVHHMRISRRSSRRTRHCCSSSPGRNRQHITTRPLGMSDSKSNLNGTNMITHGRRNTTGLTRNTNGNRSHANNGQKPTGQRRGLNRSTAFKPTRHTHHVRRLHIRTLRNSRHHTMSRQGQRRRNESRHHEPNGSSQSTIHSRPLTRPNQTTGRRRRRGTTSHKQRRREGHGSQVRRTLSTAQNARDLPHNRRTRHGKGRRNGTTHFCERPGQTVISVTRGKDRENRKSLLVPRRSEQYLCRLDTVGPAHTTLNVAQNQYGRRVTIPVHATLIGTVNVPTNIGHYFHHSVPEGVRIP